MRIAAIRDDWSDDGHRWNGAAEKDYGVHRLNGEVEASCDAQEGDALAHSVAAEVSWFEPACMSSTEYSGGRIRKLAAN